MIKEKAIICDIDNTIIDLSGRWHILDGTNTDWQKFFSPEMVATDKPIKSTIEVIKTLASKYHILFITGRNEGIRTLTMKQLDDYVGLNTDNYSLYMRPEGDYTPDVEIKQIIYNNFIEPHYEIVAAFDDKKEIIDLWRSLGITTYDVGCIVAGGGF